MQRQLVLFLFVFNLLKVLVRTWHIQKN